MTGRNNHKQCTDMKRKYTSKINSGKEENLSKKRAYDDDDIGGSLEQFWARSGTEGTEITISGHWEKDGKNVCKIKG